MTERSERAWLRLTSAERRRWVKIARDTGETLSAWLRRLAYEAEQRAKAQLEDR